MPLTAYPPPLTPTDPVTEVLHGVSITDPYRWLEDQNSPRTRMWLEEQTAYTRAYLDAIVGRKQIRKRVEELLAVEVISMPRQVGTRYFFQKREAHQQQPTIMMREGESTKEILLVDPSNRDPTGATSVGILNISRDGKLLAYSVRKGGEDSCSVEFLDVDRRVVLADRIGNGFCRGLIFSSDCRGFYYSHEMKQAGRPHYRAVFWHEFGSNHMDNQVFFGGEDSRLRLMLFGSHNGQRLGYYKLLSTAPPTIDFIVHDMVSGSLPQSIVEKFEGYFIPFFTENELIALTDWNAPNWRVVLIDLSSPQRENWRDVVPEANSRIHGICVAGGLIFVAYVKDVATVIEAFDLAGHSRGEIPVPTKGTASLLPSQADSDTLFYQFSSFTHPPSILYYHALRGNGGVWAPSRIQFDPSSVDVEQVRYRSKDGAHVPMFLISQKGLRRSDPLPTFLTGYGGFGNSITPQFTAYGTFLIERGCLFAVANLRGGAEFGEQWHVAAKRHKRQTAIDDLIAAAEWLLSSGCTAPGRLAIGGGSNAGLLVAAALTQRPNLFRAVVCLGPLLDMLRYHLFDAANIWVDEYGSADNGSDFHHLFKYSPYQRVEPGIPYPAVLLISGDADTRCNPMHARKMTARLQAASASGRPILLDYNPRWGHMPVQPLSNRIEALTDRLAFICNELGVAV